MNVELMDLDWIQLKEVGEGIQEKQIWKSSRQHIAPLLPSQDNQPCQSKMTRKQDTGCWLAAQQGNGKFGRLRLFLVFEVEPYFTVCFYVSKCKVE